MKILLIVFLVVLAGFTEELYRYVFCRGSSRLFCRLFDSKGHEDRYYEVLKEACESLEKTPCQEYTMVNARGQKLKGYYYPCGAEGKKIAFLVHGYRSDHLHGCALYYPYYASRNIDFFCCDHVASGNSEGHFIGFDVFETEDCLQWIDFLKDQFGEDVQILLHGFSMGAATVMRMSSRCPQNVKFIIEDSGFRDARASMDHQVGPFYTPLRIINRLVAGYDWNASDVTVSLAKSRIPMLFVHGKEDKLVPYENGPQLYESYQGPKDCLFMENTRHIETMYTSSDAYYKKIDSFLEKYLKE